MEKFLQIDFEEMNERLVYDTTSPSFLYWKNHPRRKVTKSKHIAGSLHTSKRTGKQYYSVTVNGTMYIAHRIIYVLHNQYLDPTYEIDHIDGNSLNNDIMNLRPVPGAVNNRNRCLAKNNKSGITGVRYVEKENAYRAYYYDANGKFREKYFPGNKLGNTEAFRLACEFRETGIRQTNERLGEYSYTNNHGLKRKTNEPNEKTQNTTTNQGT